MTLTFVFLILIIYSFLGWVLEVIYTFILKHRFVNRGFLFGPLCPIYGAGAFLVIVALEPLNDSILLLAVTGMVGATVLEYASSVVMEKLFHTRWWDYSKIKFNLNGRVCLQNALVFGILSVIIIRFVQPQVVILLSLVSDGMLEIIAISLFFIACFDCLLTLNTLLNFSKKLAQIKGFADEIVLLFEEKIWFDPYNLKKSYIRLKKIAHDEPSTLHDQQLKTFKDILKNTNGAHRLLNSFPQMTNHKHGINLESFPLCTLANKHNSG